MNDREELRTALVRVGRLTLAQAVSLTGGSPSATGRRLEGLVNEGLALKSQGAYWHPACPRRGAAHRQLVADIYVALVHLPFFAGWDPPGTGPIRPDAWIKWHHDTSWVTLALEADRGTETLGQWSQKLALYEQNTTPAVLVVVVPGLARARHLHRLLEDTRDASSFLVGTIKTVTDTLAAWPSHPLKPRGDTSHPNVETDKEPPPPRAYRFMLKGRWVDAPEAALRFATGLKAGGRERRAGYDIIHLDRTHQ